MSTRTFVDRRQFAAMALLATGAPTLAKAPVSLDLSAAVVAAERATGGRVGFAVHDMANGRRFSHRGGERFPMARTFKMLLAAAILERVDRGIDRLDRAIPVRVSDLLDVSPVAEAHVGGTATVAELTEATMIYSDNAAASLLLPAVGGPAGLTAFLRRRGDAVTRLDRNEPMTSEARPGDPRDTTSPDAVLSTWETLLLGTILSPASRGRLTGWLLANTIGDMRLRAGLPGGWRVGDKTGSGAAATGTVNDIAIAWPDGSGRAANGAPVLIASFLNGGTASTEILYRTHADLARATAAALLALDRPSNVPISGVGPRGPNAARALCEERPT